MGQEITQYDITDHQLLAIKAHASVWTDIGEAKVIHTVFGRAKVRVIREKDKNLRAGLLTALAVTAIAAAAWQGWIISQQNELLQNAAPPLPLSARIRVSPPDTQPEYIPSTTTPPSMESRSSTQVQTAINATLQNNALQQPIGLKAAKRMVVKPDIAQPLIASRPQTESLATNNTSPRNQMDMQQPHKQSVLTQSVAPAVVTSPAAKAAAQPAASRPVAAQLVREDAPTSLPAGGNQPSEPVSAQNK